MMRRSRMLIDIARRSGRSTYLILLHGRIDLMRPGIDAAFEIEHATEAVPSQKLNSLGTSHPAVAMRHDLRARIEFIETIGQFVQWNQSRTLDSRDVVLEFFADVENHHRIFLVDLLLEIGNRNARD